MSYVAITENAITVYSEADLEFAMNNITGIPAVEIMAKGGYYTISAKSGGGIESPEVQDVFDRFTVGNVLTQAEQDATRTMVITLVNAGIWGTKQANYQDGKIDTIFSFVLDSEAKALIGMHPRVPVTATNNGAVKTAEGFTFNGTTAWINLIVQQNVNAQAFTDQNPSYGYFNNFFTGGQAANTTPFGCVPSSSANRGSFFRIQPLNSLQAFFNTTTPVQNIPIPPNFTLVSGTRLGNQSIAFFDGAEQGRASPSVNTFDSNPFAIGAANIGASRTRFWQGEASWAYIGGNLTAIDIGTLNTAIRQFILDLNIIQDFIAARYSNLTAVESDRLKVFVEAEFLSGNLGKYDEFYPLSFANDADSLTGFFEKTGVPGGTLPTRVPGGWTFDGLTSRIDSAFVPSVDGFSSQLLSSQFSGFIMSGEDLISTVGRAPFGALRTGAGTVISRLYFRSSGTNFQVSIASNSAGDIARNQVLNQSDFQGVLMATSRINNTVVQSLRNGQELPVQTNNAAATQPDVSFWIGGSNNIGTMNRPFRGSIASFLVGGAVGFNQFAHYQNYLNFFIPVYTEQLLATFPGVVTAGETTKITAFLDAEIRNESWFKNDSFAWYGMNDPLNAVFDWKRGTSMTPVGAPTHTPGTGFVLNGTTQYIDTEYNPTNGPSYSLNDALAGAFCVTNSDPTGAALKSLFGVESLPRIRMFQQFNSNRLSTVINGSSGFFGGETFIASDSLYVLSRIAAVSNQMYKNGILGSSLSIVSTTVPNVNIFVGAANPASNFFAGTIAVFLAGSGSGRNQVDLNINIRALIAP